MNGKALIHGRIAAVNGDNHCFSIPFVGGYIDIGCRIRGRIDAIISIANKFRELAKDISPFLNLSGFVVQPIGIADDPPPYIGIEIGGGHAIMNLFGGR